METNKRSNQDKNYKNDIYFNSNEIKTNRVYNSIELEALDVLQLDKEFTYQELRKSYLKLSLKYHPDKNRDGTEQFKQINSAYRTLNEYNQQSHNNSIYKNMDFNNMSYRDIFSNYFDMVINKYDLNKNQMTEIFDIFTNKTKNFTFDFIDRLSQDTCCELLELITKYHYIIGLNNDIVKTIKKKLQEKYKKKKIITLNPDIYDVLNNNVYVYNVGDKKYFIPLWHNELYFDDMIVFIQPDLPGHIEIDDNNILHVHKICSINDMFSETLEIEIYRDYKLTIHTNELYCRIYQPYLIKNIGISSINENDICDTTIKNDILCHIYVKL